MQVRGGSAYCLVDLWPRTGPDGHGAEFWDSRPHEVLIEAEDILGDVIYKQVGLNQVCTLLPQFFY